MSLFPFLMHCGIYVADGSVVKAVDGTGPIQDQFLGTILFNASTGVPTFQPSQVWIRKAGPVPQSVWDDWTANRTKYTWPDIDQIGDWWDTPDAHYGDWTDADPKVCDCIIKQAHQKQFNKNDRAAYRLLGTNSNWALRCYVKSCCGYNLVLPPGAVGANEGTQCPSCGC